MFDREVRSVLTTPRAVLDRAYTMYFKLEWLVLLSTPFASDHVYLKAPLALSICSADNLYYDISAGRRAFQQWSPTLMAPTTTEVLRSIVRGAP